MSRRHLPLAVAALVLALPLTACGSDDSDSGDSGASEKGTSDDTPTVEVVDAGAEPRRVLELDLPEGQQESTTMELDENLTSNGQDLDVPLITLVLDTDVTRVDDDEIEASQTYDEVSIDSTEDPTSAAAMQESLSAIEGLSGTLVFRPDGSAVSSDFDVPEGAPEAFTATFDQFADQASNLTVPFPGEEVGVGASWVATTEIEANGIAVTQTATYTLESLDGDDYTLSVDLDQSYEAGEADGFDVTGGTGSGSGTIEGTLTQLLPTTSTSQASNTIEGTSGGQDVSVTTAIDLSVSTSVD